MSGWWFFAPVIVAAIVIYLVLRWQRKRDEQACERKP